MNFNERVYKIVRRIPSGYVVTYKQIAILLGCKAYQAVGNALRNNPYAPDVPCHRVVKSDLFIGGFMGQTSGEEIERKVRMLKEEGVKFENKIVKKEYVYEF